MPTGNVWFTIFGHKPKRSIRAKERKQTTQCKSNDEKTLLYRFIRKLGFEIIED